MAMDDEDDAARRKARFSMDLETMSIEGLTEYIGDLEAEIARTREVIARKQAARQGAESFFRK